MFILDTPANHAIDPLNSGINPRVRPTQGNHLIPAHHSTGEPRSLRLFPVHTLRQGAEGELHAVDFAGLLAIFAVVLPSEIYVEHAKA